LLPRAERNDAADWIVRGDTDGNAVTRHHLDAEPSHPPAQLSEYFVPRVALDAIQPAGMHRYNRALHVYEIVFAQ
jgi:hypothetical protein